MLCMLIFNIEYATFLCYSVVYIQLWVSHKDSLNKSESKTKFSHILR